MSEIHRMLLSAQMEKVFEWEKWRHLIPAIEFPAGWKIQMSPPFCAAVVRFRVQIPGCKHDISVYLDCYEELGCFGEPYWEVYPCGDDGPGRCAMNDTAMLLKLIADQSEPEESK